MAEKGYYYLKLKENFFETDELKILESLENGYLYSNILLKLYLKALKNEGKLTFNDYIPYDVKMISVITGHNKDIVEKAIKIFQSMHLIEILDNGTIFMLDMQNLIGSISSEGIRKQEYRARIEQEKKDNGTKLGQCPDIISNSISNLLSNSISIKDNNSKKEKDKEKEKSEIFDYWNSHKIIVHQKMTNIIESAINSALKEYSKEEIILAIDNYNTMLKDKDYKLCDYVWTIDKFLKQKNAMPEFMENGSKWLNYQNYLKSSNKEQKSENNDYLSKLLKSTEV